MSVLGDLVEYLGRFIDTDASKAEVGIKTAGTGVVVPQYVIENVVENLETAKSGIESTLSSMLEESIGNAPVSRKRTRKKATIVRKPKKGATRKQPVKKKSATKRR
jgi:hypothetical protein